MKVSLKHSVPVLSISLTPHQYQETEHHGWIFRDHFVEKGKEGASAALSILQHAQVFIPKANMSAQKRLRISAACLISCCASSIDQALIWMIAGPIITAKRTGRKKIIMGTVSLGGRAAAFFSASAMRMSRLSCERARSAVASGVP